MKQKFIISGEVLKAYIQCPGTLQSDITIPKAVKEIGEEVLKGYKGLTEIIPEGVTIIDENAFKGCKTLQIVTLPSSLKVIGEFVFSECESLVEIIIPRNVTIIEKNAFSCCTNLRRVILPSALKEIGEFVFASCESLTDITIPEGVTKIAECGFFDCESLQSVSLPRTLKEIGEAAFGGCKALTEIVFSVCPAKVHPDAFFECPDNLTVIVEDDDEKKKFLCMPVFAGKTIVTISQKLLSIGFTRKQVIEISCLNYDDKLCFLGCNTENQNLFVAFSESEGGGAWEATNLNGGSVRIEGVPSTVSCETLLELMRQYESKHGTPMRNILPVITASSLENEDDCPSNYILAALKELEAIQAAKAATSIQSLFRGCMVRRSVQKKQRPIICSHCQTEVTNPIL